jgi:hypothetical protein
LFVTIWVAVIGSLLTIDDAKRACYEKWSFTKYRALLAGPLFFPWACTRAKNEDKAIFSTRSQLLLYVARRHVCFVLKQYL